MTPPIENLPTWLVDWSLVTIIDNTLPPRDPNDDDNEDDEDDEDDERHNERHDEDDEDDEDDEPAVIREPRPGRIAPHPPQLSPRSITKAPGRPALGDNSVSHSSSCHVEGRRSSPQPENLIGCLLP